MISDFFVCPNSSPCGPCKVVRKLRSALPGVDVPPSAHLDATTMLVALTREDTGQVVLVHEVPLPALSPFLLGCRSDVLLLVLCQDELCAPTLFSTASFPLAICTASHRLGDAKAVTPVVPLHVLLQVHGKLPVGSRSARDSGQCVLATTRAELLVHVLGGQEAGMAPLDERLQVLDSLQGGRRQEIQIHLKQDVLTLNINQ